jgi:hypothetical protein
MQSQHPVATTHRLLPQLAADADCAGNSLSGCQKLSGLTSPLHEHSDTHSHQKLHAHLDCDQAAGDNNNSKGQAMSLNLGAEVEFLLGKRLHGLALQWFCRSAANAACAEAASSSSCSSASITYFPQLSPLAVVKYVCRFSTLCCGLLVTVSTP